MFDLLVTKDDPSNEVSTNKSKKSNFMDQTSAKVKVKAVFYRENPRKILSLVLTFGHVLYP